MKFPLFKNSDGKQSASFTMMIIGFSVVTLWLLVSIFASIAGLETREFSSSEAMAYFSPLALLYFGRRWADATKPQPDASEPEETPEEPTPAPKKAKVSKKTSAK
jgi:hypothetical protein